MNCTQMNGLPPTPPRTGCFGITICSLAGMTVTSTIWPSVKVCVPFMLLVKVISTPYPPRNEPPENVIRGPGLLLQSYAEKSAEMVTGSGSVVLLMCGNDDEDAANDGEVRASFDDPSVHAPATKSAPSRATAFRSVPVHMLASLSLRSGCRLRPTWRAPPTGTERQDPPPSGQEAYLGSRVRECTLCTHPVAARARQRRGASATTEFSVKLGALLGVASKRLLLFVRGDQGRRPNAVASARSATARARASLPGCDRPGSTSKARQGESDHAIAETAPQRRQRRVGAESTTGLRSQQLGQTAYLPSSEVGAASSGLRRTSDHMGRRSGRICRKARGTRNKRLLTSSTVSPVVSSTTRYHAPRRSGQSIPARTRAQYCTCGMRVLPERRSTCQSRTPIMSAPGGSGL